MARALFALTLLLLAPALAAGQVDTTAPGVRLHLPGSVPEVSVPPVHRLAAAVLRPDPSGVAAAWARGVGLVMDSLRQGRTQARLLQALYGRPAATASDRGLAGLGRRYADLSIEGNAGVEIRSDRFKNERCTPYQLQDISSGCQGHFTPPRIDDEMVFRAGGVVGQRLHINVDYDNKRDFDALNDIRVFYQGLPDEIVQRVEVGTVTFTPPPSRFITAAVPAYSFGINSRFEFGPLTLGALAASQKGSAVTERTYTVGATTSQPQDRVLRDLDFEQGRFFWVVDPATVAGYPAVDILNVSGSAVDESARPVEVRIYRYRPGAAGLGGIRASGYRPDSDQRLGRVAWTLLVAGQDYVLDPSGLWVALTNRLAEGDYLAVSYRTATNVVVGTFPSVDDPTANDSLLLVVEPRRGAEVPTFRYEMRNVYRVAGADLDRGSLKVDLSLNRTESPAQGAATYLALLGLAVPADPNVIDVANRVFPRTRDVVASDRMGESFIVFPHLQPFADAGKLTPAERTDSLYRTPLYMLFTQGPSPRFQFRLQYNAAGGGDRSLIELNSFQIRDGSEQISAGGRVLQRGVDYTISYDLGRVTFLDPEILFGTGQTTVTARFEERGIFAVAPTTIYGLTSTYKVGQAGTLNLIGIYQRENTVFNRPPVGFEPKANLVGGVTGDFRFRPAWATDAMNSLVSGGTEVPSSLSLQGEFAFTAPQANRAGQAYLEEFEGGSGLPISLRESDWGFSGRPEQPDGLEDIGLGGGLDSADAVQLTWQNLIANSNGEPVQVRSQEIDSLIRITGGAQPIETVLYFALHADTAGGFQRADNTLRWKFPRRDFRPRWRSVISTLSPTGIDLTQNEFLEFWVYEIPPGASADSAGVNLVVDLGTVGEDALAIAPESLTVTGTDSAWAGRRYAGVGRLDTEREPTGVFNAALDDNGILVDRPDSLVVNGVPTEDVATCSQSLSGAVNLYFWGDLNVRCTKGNGTLDTEDHNGDNVLDVGGAGDHVMRYVVDLRSLKYFVRNGGPGWRLFRIPLRGPDAIPLGAPNMRLVQHLRLTIAAPADAGVPDRVGRFAFARMRLTGSPWVRRSDKPVLGLGGATAEPHGDVVVTSISTENRELGYEPPPGVTDEAGRSDGTGGQQINEHSLRIIGHDLREGERAEGYFRFLAGPQNLLKYRTLRLWLRGRGEGWDDGRLQAVFKAASDHRNFYAYRVGTLTDSWGQEAVVDLDIWRKLRAQIETSWLQGLPPGGSTLCGAGDSTAYVACQGPYFVQVADPGINPPNLAAVQEIDAAVYYAGTGTPLTEAEVWVDDVRLVDPVNAVGTATALSARLAAADVADLSVGYVRQDGNFQQIGQDPRFQTTATTQVSSSVRLDRFLPARLGVSIPATASYTHSTTDPFLVRGTDLRADDLPGLRKPFASQWSWGMSVRRSQRGQRWTTRAFVDPLSLNGQYSTSGSQTEQSRAATSSYGLGGNYGLQLRRQGPRLPFDGLVKALPAWLRESPVGEGMRGSILALAPTSLRLTTGLSRSENTFTNYSVAVARPDDSLRTPTLNLMHEWRNSAGITFQPLGMLTLDGNLQSTRDLRHYSDSTTLGRLVEAERRELLGLDVGVERDRQVGTSVVLTPRLATWFRPRYLRSSSFNLTRSLTSREPVRSEGDSGAFLLPQTFNNLQRNELAAGVDLDRVVKLIAGDSTPMARFFRRLRPLDGSLRRTRTSTFDLTTFDPDLGYALALGGPEAFRSQHGESALSTSEMNEARLGGSADLPGGVSISLSTSEIVSRQSNRVGDAFAEVETRQREWPQGSLRWSRVLRRGPMTLLTLGGTVSRREGNTTTRSAAGDVLGRTVTETYAPSMVLGFRNGPTANVSFTRTAQVNENNANRTESGNDQWSATVSHSLRLPASLSVSRRSLRASVYGQQLRSQTCLWLASAPTAGCRTVADIHRLTLNGGLTTEVLSSAEGGVNFQYVANDIRHLNQRTTQLSIVLSLRVQLSTGDLR